MFDALAAMVCVAAVALSTVAHGSSLAPRRDPPVRALEAGSLEAGSLEALREGLGPIGVPVIAISIPRQIRQADLARWCRLLEIEPSLQARISRAWIEAAKRDDALRLRRLPPLLDLAAVVSRPGTAMTEEQVSRVSADLARMRRSVISDMLLQEREALLQALLLQAEGERGAEPREATAAELEALDGLAQLRAIELVEQAVSTPAFARLGLGRFLETRGLSALNEPSRTVAMAVFRDGLIELEGLAQAHQIALGRSIGIGARVMLGSRVQRKHGTVGMQAVAEWSKGAEPARRAVARAAERLFEANRAVLESICAAVPAEDAKRLRQRYDQAVFGPFARAPWDTRELLASDGADARSAQEAMQTLLAEYETEAELRRLELRQEFIRCQMESTSATTVRDEDLARARRRVAEIHRRARDAAMALIDQVRGLKDLEERNAWDAVVDRFRTQSEADEIMQLDALGPQMIDR
jgi:hypothetical protein